MKTPQVDFWKGTFGKEYTDRNPQSLEEWDALYINQYGVTKTEINNHVIVGLAKDARILEVGCNIGLQLAGLQRMGFTNLYGIELQEYAVQKSQYLFKNLNIIQGSGFDIPFKDGYFDLVMTNGVLIHIKPDNLPLIMKEMVRCSKQYIMGFEYYSETMNEINYRGNSGFLWKGNYAEEFLKLDAGLSVVDTKLYPYTNQLESGNTDILYLLKK